MHEYLSAKEGNESRAVIWKRLQDKTREMCDVCSTTLFNVHFTCQDCSVLVCLDCYTTRNNAAKLDYSSQKDILRPYR